MEISVDFNGFKMEAYRSKYNTYGTYYMALYGTKRAQTYKVLLNLDFKFNFYENVQFLIQLCFKSSLKKVVSLSRTDLTMQFS